MKRFLRLVCLVLVVSLLAAVPAYAEEPTTRASNFFSSYRAYCTKKTSTQLAVSFQVVGAGIMDELGASQVKVQRSTDGENWTTIRTFKKDTYSSMIDTDAGVHGTNLYCTITSGYYYRAVITFYAKNSTGTGYHYYYTGKI